MQLVSDWEKEHGKEYPTWASVWHYDAYGEAFMAERWSNVKEFYETERKEDGNTGYRPWQYYYEPMVLLPTDEPPKTGVLLRRTINEVREVNE